MNKAQCFKWKSHSQGAGQVPVYNLRGSLLRKRKGFSHLRSLHKLTQVTQAATTSFTSKEKGEEEFDKDIALKTWILLLTRAVEEDLARQAPKCANTFCNKFKPQISKNCKWKQRLILGRKEWLCELCNSAYDAKQYCEFCAQLYLETTLESSALDGKEWAQCEKFEKCRRWAHVECLAVKYCKTRDEVVSDDFKYFCCSCKKKAGTKKRKKVNGKCDIVETDTKSVLRKIKRKCRKT